MLAGSRDAKTYSNMGGGGEGWGEKRTTHSTGIEFQHAKSLQLWGKLSFLSQAPLSGTSPPMHLCAVAQNRKRNRKKEEKKKSPALGMTSCLWNLLSSSFTHSLSDFPSWLSRPVPLQTLELDSRLLHLVLETCLGPILLPDLGLLHVTIPDDK